LCGEEDEEDERMPSLYTLEVVGDRSIGEASPLAWLRLPKRRLGASFDAAEKTHRDWVAARRA
jgi:hypothetical protein